MEEIERELVALKGQIKSNRINIEKLEEKVEELSKEIKETREVAVIVEADLRNVKDILKGVNSLLYGVLSGVTLLILSQFFQLMNK